MKVTITKIRTNRRYEGWVGNHAYDFEFVDQDGNIGSREAFMCMNDLTIGSVIAL